MSRSAPESLGRAVFMLRLVPEGLCSAPLVVRPVPGGLVHAELLRRPALILLEPGELVIRLVTRGLRQTQLVVNADAVADQLLVLICLLLKRGSPSAARRSWNGCSGAERTLAATHWRHQPLWGAMASARPS